MMFEKSCGIVVFHENDRREYLLLHYPGGHWDLPKGHVEKDETEEETALRELEEETGIGQAEFIPGYREVISYTYHRGPKLSTKEVVYFLASTNEKGITISHEHQDFLWLPYEEAVEKLTFENAKELVRKAEKKLA